MTRRALLLGINEYDEVNDLTGSVADAIAVRLMLKCNADGSLNYLLAYGGEHR